MSCTPKKDLEYVLTKYQYSEYKTTMANPEMMAEEEIFSTADFHEYNKELRVCKVLREPNIEHLRAMPWLIGVLAKILTEKYEF